MSEMRLAGNAAAPRLKLQQTFIPFAALLKAVPGSQIPLVADKAPIQGRDTIFVCHDRVCQLPVHDVVQALEQIKT